MEWSGVGVSGRADVGLAIERSNLRAVTGPARERLLAGARTRRIEAGAVVQDQGETGHHIHLVVSGLLRMVVRDPDGRSITVRYCRTGSLIGVASLFGPDFVLPVTIEALTPVELVDLRPGTVTELAGSDPRVATALLAEVSERVQRFVEEIPLASFATVSQRVARHLLDLAAATDGGPPVARITQEQLAEAVGTVREVAARTLRALRDQGLVRTERNRITIVDPARLLDVATGLA